MQNFVPECCPIRPFQVKYIKTLSLPILQDGNFDILNATLYIVLQF